MPLDVARGLCIFPPTHWGLGLPDMITDTYVVRSRIAVDLWYPNWRGLFYPCQVEHVK